MVNVEQLGWDPAAVGEIDHRLLKSPHVKLRSFTEGPHGDVVYAIDLRIKKPNEEIMPITVMHSFEHCLLAGFLKYLPENFISIGLMGCQTGFYLVLFNEGRFDIICGVYETILKDILAASEVPFVRIDQCGNFRNHCLEDVQNLAQELLDEKSNWRRVV